MSLSKVQPFLDKAFEFLRDREFSVSREDWTKFCASQGMSLDKLQSAKLELLRQSQKIDDDSERLKQIFCCDPFDVANTKALRDIWHDKAESQPEPYQRWFSDISIHLLDLSSEPPSNPVSVIPSPTTPISTISNPIPVSVPPKLSKELLSAVITGSIIGLFIMSALIINNYLNKPQIITQKEKVISTPLPISQTKPQELITTSPTVSPSKNLQPNLQSQYKSQSETPPTIPLPTKNKTSSNSTIGTNAQIVGKSGSKNIRSGPGTSYSSLHIAYTGDRVKIISSDTDVGGYRWYKVDFPNSDVTGWIAAQLLAIDGQTPPKHSTVSPSYSSNVNANARIGGKQLGTKNLRSGPGTAYGIIAKINTGEDIEILDKSQDSGGYVWYQVRHQQSGTKGWIAAQLVNVK